jgi:SM-20-related protein
MQAVRTTNALSLHQQGSDLRPQDSDAGGIRRVPHEVPRYFNSLVIDGFLTDDLHAALLNYALSNETSFLPAAVTSNRSPDGVVDPEFRKSWRCSEGLGELTPAFRDAIRSGLVAQTPKLGVPDFTIARLELELVAHRHGSFFRRHIDTATQSARDSQASDRIVTAVYYFHAAPKRFSGGELALAPLGRGEPKLIEPRNNRLVAFASFVPHEVLPVVCQIDEFSHARFAVNIWLHRAKRAT